MSFPAKSPLDGYFTNKSKNLSIPQNDDDNFKFKYVPGNQLKYIVDDVKRKRLKNKEDNKWQSFTKEYKSKMMNIKKDNMLENPSSKVILNGNLKIKSRSQILDDQLDDITNKIDEIYDCDNTQFQDTEDKEIECTNLSLGNGFSDSETDCNFDDDIQNEKNYHSNCEIAIQKDHQDDTYVRPDPQSTYKIIGFQEKVLETLDEIFDNLDRIPVPDGENDLKRRQQRGSEFAIRFSRNYLYDLNRCITQIQKHVYVVTSSGHVEPSKRVILFHMHLIEQKLVAAYQLLLHALAAYAKHIPSSLYKGHWEKLKEVLHITLNLSNICNKIKIRESYYGSGDSNISPLENEIHNKCKSILNKLKMNWSNECITPIDNSNVPLDSNKKLSNCRSAPIRYKMYNCEKPMSHHYKFASCGFKKNRSKQNVLSANIVSSDSHTNNGSCNMNRKKSSSSRQERKNTALRKRGDIKTVMATMTHFDESSIELDDEMDRKNKSRKKVSKFISHNKCRRESCSDSKIIDTEKNMANKKAKITQEDLLNLIPLIADLLSRIEDKKINNLDNSFSTSEEKILQIFNKYKTVKNLKTGNSSQSARIAPDSMLSESFISSVESARKCKGEMNNMQLICLSSEDAKKDSKYCDVSCQANNDTGLLNQTSNGSDRKNAIIQRKNGLVQLEVQENVLSTFLQYRQEYQDHCQTHSMYGNNSQNKPWEIVAGISDKLIDELIVEIASELQMNEVLQKLFEQEFREC